MVTNFLRSSVRLWIATQQWLGIWCSFHDESLPLNWQLFLVCPRTCTLPWWCPIVTARYPVCDLFFWGHLRSQVNVCKQGTVGYLKEVFCVEINVIPQQSSFRTDPRGKICKNGTSFANVIFKNWSLFFEICSFTGIHGTDTCVSVHNKTLRKFKK